MRSDGGYVPVKDAPQVEFTSPEKPEIRSPKFCWTRLYAALVQSVQVTLEGTLGTLPLVICDTSDSILATVSVPVYGSRLFSVSVTHSALLLLVLRWSEVSGPCEFRAALPVLTLRDTRPVGRSGTPFAPRS